MAGRKAKCLKCAQVIVIPNPERDRWPPGMEPPGMKHSSATPAAQQAAPPKKSQAAPPQTARPAAVKPAAAQQGAGSPPRAQPVAKPVAPSQPIVAAPVINVQPQAAPAIPVAKAMPVVPAVSATQRPVPKPVIPPVAETVSEDLDDLLEFELAAPVLPSAKGPSDNPYQSPQAAAVDKRAAASAKSVRYGDTLQTTWRIYKANFGPCLAGSVLSAIGAGVILGLIELGTQGFVALVQQNQWQSNTLAIVFAITLVLAMFSTILFFTMGLIDFLLQIARGREADFSRLVGATDLLLPSLGLLLIVLLAVTVGLILLIVPGVLIMLLFALAPFALVERQEGVIAALSTSARLVSANLLTIVLLLMTVWPACAVISTVTCGLGQLVTAPFQMLLMIVIYRRASGKRLVGD